HLAARELLHRKVGAGILCEPALLLQKLVAGMGHRNVAGAGAPLRVLLRLAEKMEELGDRVVFGAAAIRCRQHPEARAADRGVYRLADDVRIERQKSRRPAELCAALQ